MSTEKLYITEKEAVERYGYSRAWWQNMRWKGGSPPFIKVNGGAIRYPVKACDEWFAKHQVKTSTSEKVAGVNHGN